MHKDLLTVSILCEEPKNQLMLPGVWPRARDMTRLSSVVGTVPGVCG